MQSKIWTMLCLSKKAASYITPVVYTSLKRVIIELQSLISKAPCYQINTVMKLMHGISISRARKHL